MKDARFAKFVLAVNAAVPLAMLGWDAYAHQLGANPIEYGLRTTGMLALIFLTLSLVITPARKLTGYNALSHFRRMLGLYAFFYGCLHFGIYFVFDRSLSVKSTIADTADRPFILLGMATLFMLIPLAATSTNGIIKRMGAKQWKQLHRLVYVAAIGGVLHYYKLVKADVTKPIIFAIVLALLLGYRLAVWMRQRLRKVKGPTPAQVA